MSAPVSRRRVHDQRQRQARTDAIAMAVSAVVLGLAAFVLGLLWLIEGGWIQ